jgi:hypothetical protein
VAQAVLLGSTAALLFGSSILASVPASRLGGAWPAALWLALIGATSALVVASFSGAPTGDGGDWWFVIAAGGAYGGAVLLWFIAVEFGHVTLLAPIVACDGAIAAVLATITGAPLSLVVGAALAVMVVALIAVARSAAILTAGHVRYGVERPRPVAGTVVLGLATAVCFGIVFFASGEASGINALWVVAISRVVSLGVVLGACLHRRQFLPGWEALPWVAAAAVLDVSGYIAYVYGARASLPVAAVAASQYAAVTAVGGVLAFGERLSRVQILGAVCLIGAAGLIASQST